MSEFQDDDVVMYEWYDHDIHTTNISFEFTDRALVNDNTAKWLLKDLKMLWTEVAKIRGRSLADELELTCDHVKSNICLCDWGDDCPMNSEPDFTYCPKCGEKL